MVTYKHVKILNNFKKNVHFMCTSAWKKTKIKRFDMTTLIEVDLKSCRAECQFSHRGHH